MAMRETTQIRMKIAIAIYLILGLVDLVMGFIYLTTDRFLSYHAEAVGIPWREIDSGMQTLILALMKLAGGGWLALGLLTIVLAAGLLIKNHALARWAVPAGTIVFWAASFMATWSVYQATGAQTPWAPSLGAIGMAIIAMTIDAPWSSRNRRRD